ncbi:MAG: ATP-binding protein [Spirochaetaceae bacterium]|nr:ATP-binding protein [Spirochaetaceae bacterium]
MFAEVEINTITLIAGLNSTGKSTVGKVLYSIFNSFYNIEETSIQTIKGLITRYIEDKFFGYDSMRLKVDRCVTELLTRRNIAKKEDIKEIIMMYLGSAFFSDQTDDSYYNNIVDLLNISTDEIYRNLLENKLHGEFEDQIQNLYSNSNSYISLDIKDSNIYVEIENNKVSHLNNFINLKTESIYIDDPFILDTLNAKYFSYRRDHKSDLYKKLRRGLIDNDNMENILHDIVMNKKISKIYDKLNSICKGNILLSQKEGINFKIEDSKENLKLINISTGLKTFVIIKTLLLNGVLEKKGLLILDEPEIHLHPEWQKLLAEIIVLIQIEFDMHILINSHSPYFINAIDVYAQKYKIRKTCKFYLAKDIDDTHKQSEIKDVSNNLEEINHLLFIPLQDLENERSLLEEDDE